MAKILTFFNHKSGVGKTTLAYNVAWGLSVVGKKVLMIDGDAQCNLTEITLCDADETAQFEYRDNIHAYFFQYIQPKPGVTLTKPELFVKRDGLHLLPGSLSLAELESPIALSVAGIPAMSDIPSNIYSALNTIGDGFDYVIIDLSPALSATNQLFLMLSDYFIIPVNPSIFCRQALTNLGEIFRTWNSSLSGSELFKKKLKPLPLMLGIVCLNYRPFARKNEEWVKSAARFSAIMDELNSKAIELATDLSGFRMALSKTEFGGIFSDASPYRIANMPDYNQLAMISESEKVPVNGLDSKILNKHKINTVEYRSKLDDFKGQCERIVNGLLKLS